MNEYSLQRPLVRCCADVRCEHCCWLLTELKLCKGWFGWISASCFNRGAISLVTFLFPQLLRFPGAWGDGALRVDFSKWLHAVSLREARAQPWKLQSVSSCWALLSKCRHVYWPVPTAGGLPGSWPAGVTGNSRLLLPSRGSRQRTEGWRVTQICCIPIGPGSLHRP